MSQLDFLRDDQGDEECATGPRSSFTRVAAHHTLPLLALAEILPPSKRRLIKASGSLAVVIEAPSAAWVEPTRRACEGRRDWTTVFARAGWSRSTDRPDRANDEVAQILAGGGQVLGVSHAPRRYLPSALVLAADLTLKMDTPSNRVISRVIRAATGLRPRSMPDRICAGLDFHEICAAVRVGTSAADCVDRLTAATTAKTVVDPGVAQAPPFEDLRGFGAAHRWGMRLMSELEEWRAGHLALEAIDKNVVLASEPGLGKSTFVRALARSARLPLVSSSVGSWFVDSNGFLDGIIRQVDNVFTACFAVSPCILFLDELDAIPNRSSMTERAREWWSPIVTHILMLLDSSSSGGVSRVCVIGATNYGNKLDPALVRPGRLGRVIEIRRPAAGDLACIVRQHLGEDLADMDLKLVGELAVGASGADAAGWVREARARARAEGRPIRPADLLAVVAPPDTRSAAAMWRGSLHEAGHAVAMELLRVGRVEQVNVIARGTTGGVSRSASSLEDPPTRGDLERVAVCLLAGRGAEVVFLGAASAGSGGAPQSDLAQATKLVAAIHGSAGLGDTISYRGTGDELLTQLGLDPAFRKIVEKHLGELQAQAERFVAEHRSTIEKVARRLVAKRVLGGDDLRSLLRRSCRRGRRRAAGGTGRSLGPAPPSSRSSRA